MPRHRLYIPRETSISWLPARTHHGISNCMNGVACGNVASLKSSSTSPDIVGGRQPGSNYYPVDHRQRPIQEHRRTRRHPRHHTYVHHILLYQNTNFVDISPKDFAAVEQARESRRRKVRLRRCYCDAQLLVTTIPSHAHEVLHRRINTRVFLRVRLSFLRDDSSLYALDARTSYEACWR